MIDNKPAVFISCSEKYKERVAYRFRDVIEAVGLRAVIVSDLPSPAGAFSPEEKVDAYLDRSEAALILATPDDKVGDSWQPRLNIADEIGRARSRDSIRGRVCVLKAASVRLHSNINPAYDRLDPEDLAPALTVLLEQLREWGLTTATVDPKHVRARPPVADEEVLAGLRMEDTKQTYAHVREQLSKRRKYEQRAYVDRIVSVIRNRDEWDVRATASHMLEAVADVDVGLVPVNVVEELAFDPDFSVRSSAAMILYLTSLSAPGLVPVDLVARLAKPAEEDWYVFMPALSALQELALSREAAMERIELLARSPDHDDREYAVTALRDIAAVNRAAIRADVVDFLTKDRVEPIRRIAQQVAALIEGVTEEERRRVYYRFGPF